MSKYFPLPKIYTHSPYDIIPYETPAYDSVYSALRTILKDPIQGSYTRYSLSKLPTPEVAWKLHDDVINKIALVVRLPYEGSIHAAALMVKMGTHTFEETWEEYKDQWYEDLSAQVAHLEKGNGP